jgi:hypothetical protein
MSAYGIADLTTQHDTLRFDVSQVKNRMDYPRIPAPSKTVRFECSREALTNLIEEFKTNCLITLDEDKAIVKMMDRHDEPGKFDILITTRALLDLIRHFGAFDDSRQGIGKESNSTELMKTFCTHISQL